MGTDSPHHLRSIAPVRRRSNPWPSLVDLFSALLVFVFAALLLAEGNNEIETARGLGLAVDSLANAVRDAVGGEWEVRRCGLDTCVDLNIQFQVGTDVFSSEGERNRLQAACRTLKHGLDRLPRSALDKVRVAIEGHADRQLRRNLPPMAHVLVNWQVSAQRSARVIYEFSTCGLGADSYPLLAAAYGDTDPLCNEETSECYQRNRRVTLRLQVDSRRFDSEEATR